LIKKFGISDTNKENTLNNFNFIYKRSNSVKGSYDSEINIKKNNNNNNNNNYININNNNNNNNFSTKKIFENLLTKNSTKNFQKKNSFSNFDNNNNNNKQRRSTSSHKNLENSKTFLFMEKMKKQMNFNIDNIENENDNSLIEPEDRKEKNEILKKFKNNVHILNSNKEKENENSNKSIVSKIYYGEFKENLIEGFGVEYNLKGFKIEGEWQNNEIFGFIRVEYDTGERLIGEVYHGKIKSGEYFDKDNKEILDKKRQIELMDLIGL